MSNSSQIANVFKTLLVCGTVTFLGYLGFVLLERKLKEVQSARVLAETAEIQQFRSEIESSQTDVAALQEQVANVDSRHSTLTGSLSEIREQFASMESRYSVLNRQLEAISDTAKTTQADSEAPQVAEPTVLFGLSPNTSIEYGSESSPSLRVSGRHSGLSSKPNSQSRLSF